MNAFYSTVPGNSIVNNYAYTIRFVTAGIIVRSILPALTAQGYLIINRISQMPAAGGVMNSGSVFGVQTATHALVSGLEVPILFRPLGSASRAFVPFGQSNAVTPNFGFDVITLEVIGGPVTAGINMLDIEFVYNVEFTLTPANEGIQQFLPVSAPSNPIMVNVANKASEALGDLTYTSVQSFGKAAVRVVADRLLGISIPTSQATIQDQILMT